MYEDDGLNSGKTDGRKRAYTSRTVVITPALPVLLERQLRMPITFALGFAGGSSSASDGAVFEMLKALQVHVTALLIDEPIVGVCRYPPKMLACETMEETYPAVSCFEIRVEFSPSIAFFVVL
jgi:hypothetical protein